MLLDIREREREVAQANRLVQAAPRPANPFVQAAARPAPPVPERVDPPVFNDFLEMLGGMFRPAVPEPPRHEQPRPPPQNFGFGDDGDFEWIDNPCTYPQCIMAPVLIYSISTSCCKHDTPIHPRNDYDPYLRVLQQPTQQHQ